MAHSGDIKVLTKGQSFGLKKTSPGQSLDENMNIALRLILKSAEPGFTQGLVKISGWMFPVGVQGWILYRSWQ